MVCQRCISAVKTIFEKLEIHPISVELGEVEIFESSIESIYGMLEEELGKQGFEILNSKTSQTIEKIKTLIVDLIQNKNNQLKGSLSDYLAAELHQDYSSISKLFSAVEGKTIEKFYILQKIEKVKELLVYDELSLSEISYRLNYSSAAYLSNQFKKLTGLSPSHFKRLGKSKRNSLHDL